MTYIQTRDSGVGTAGAAALGAGAGLLGGLLIADLATPHYGGYGGYGYGGPPTVIGELLARGPGCRAGEPHACGRPVLPPPATPCLVRARPRAHPPARPPACLTTPAAFPPAENNTVIVENNDYTSYTDVGSYTDIQAYDDGFW